jgi:hypothetical protein
LIEIADALGDMMYIPCDYNWAWFTHKIEAVLMKFNAVIWVN